MRSMQFRLPSTAILSTLLIAEFFIFDVFTSRHHTWIYPRWHDQVQYLTEVYLGHEASRLNGFLSGIWYALTKPSAQGMMDCPLTVIIFELTGPSRSAALSLNIIFFIGFQIALYSTVRRFFKSQNLAWLSIALTLCWETIYSGSPGSATDFRLDLMGSCAFGASLAVLLSSRNLMTRRSAILFGLSVAFTILVRFLTGTYFVLIFSCLFIIFYFGQERSRRIQNLFISIAVVLVAAGPFFWMNRNWIWDYYYIGHYFGPESAIRNPHMNVIQSIRFLLINLYGGHLGIAFISMSLIVLIISFLRINPTIRRKKADDQIASVKEYWITPSLIYLICPFILLALHNQKSSIVVSIFVPPLIAVIIGWSSPPWKNDDSNRQLYPFISHSLMRSVIGFLLCASFGNFVYREVHSHVDANFERDARKVNVLADNIYRRVISAKLASPRVGVDQITDCLGGLVLPVICYERHKVWIPFVLTLPTGIASDSESLLMERVENSDFIFLAVADGGTPLYPYDAQMRSLREKHLNWCRTNLRLVERFDLFGRTWELYEKPFISNEDKAT